MLCKIYIRVINNNIKYLMQLGIIFFTLIFRAKKLLPYQKKKNKYRSSAAAAAQKTKK
jgi:hypothetical protein